MTTIDTHELKTLSASIANMGGRLPAEVRATVSKGALNIKTEARNNVSKHPTWRHLAASIGYDMQGDAFHAQATVGYNDVGQGELAGIAEFGSARKSPHPALFPAFDHEAPRFQKAIADIVAKAKL